MNLLEFNNQILTFNKLRVHINNPTIIKIQHINNLQ